MSETRKEAAVKAALMSVAGAADVALRLSKRLQLCCEYGAQDAQIADYDDAHVEEELLLIRAYLRQARDFERLAYLEKLGER
jgi:hypothetical protein